MTKTRGYAGNGRGYAAQRSGRKSGAKPPVKGKSSAGESGAEKLIWPSGEKKKKGTSGTAQLRKRMLMLAAFMLAGYIGVIGFLAWYQLINNETWQKLATEQQLSDTELPAQRGTIFDSNMETLVQSTTAWVVSLRPADIKDEQRDLIVTRLSEILGLDVTYIENRLAIDSTEVKLKGKADKNQKDEIMSFICDSDGETVVKGVKLTTDTKRNYSRGTLLSTILGFTGTDNTGLYGLELQYDDELSGVPGRIVTVKNARSGEMPFDYNTLVEAQSGNSLVLTVDATVQQTLEKYLAEAVEVNRVKNRACGIIMNVNTGAILAMATVPNYDPADYTALSDASLAQEIAQIPDSDTRQKALSEAQNSQWRNKAISDSYEPGSVFKPVTMSAALEEGLTSLGNNFFCKGYVQFGSRRISCHKAGGHGAESLTMGMVNSCNPVFMALGERLGGSGFFKYYKAFGFTEKTGIDLPGEASPVSGVNYHTEKSLNEHPADLAVSSFGQTNTVTPLQMITAISAISNGGFLMQPYVVTQVLDSDGNIISTTEPTVKRQVISSQTSDIVNSMLEATVSGGTAKNCYIAGYRIGGKTGTSEKIAEQAQTGERNYIASFCAIAPSDDPEIAVLIILDEPKGANHMGGTIAAPVARNVLNEVLPYLGIETIYTTDDVKKLDTIAPNLKDKNLEDAKKALESKGLKIRIIGSGDKVTGQTPMAGQSIPKGGTVVVTTEESGETPTTKVPKVTGMTPGEANRAITNAHLNIRYSGSGYDTTQGVSTSQSIPSGSTVAEGTVVTVEFIMSGATD